MANILIATFGSFGDLHPYIAVGLELQRRRHQVTIATSAYYRAKIRAEGLGFQAVRPDASLEDRAMLTYIFDARRGSERIIRMVASVARESYADTVGPAEAADLIVTHPLSFGAVLAAEKLRKRWVSSVLAPISFISAYDPPVPANAPWLRKLRVLGPGFMKRLWDIARRVSARWARPVLELRRELGLPSSGSPIFEGAHSPRLVLALFSRHLAELQPDWPAQTVVTGFPFFDRRHEADAPDALHRFLDDGPAPVVFTLGSSAVAAAGEFYRRSLEAARRLGTRAVFLTGGHPQGLPERLPPGVIALAYAPHSEVFPSAAVNVHQGGIGTTGQAMRAGRPMLVVPFGFDQYDNAERVRGAGAGEVLDRSHYDARRAEAKLRLLLERPEYARAAAALGRRVAAEDGAAAAASAIEACLG